MKSIPQTTRVLAFAMCMMALLFGATNFLEAAKGKNNRAEIRVEGTLTSIDLVNAKVSITRQNQTVVVVAVSPTTKLERNDLHVALTAFKIGDRAQARIASATGVTTKLEATGP